MRLYERHRLYKELDRITKTEEFADLGDKSAIEKAKEAKAKIDKYDYENMTPKQKLHFEIEKKLAGDREKDLLEG